MKYLPVRNFGAVSSALNFNTPDCNVTGGCDLYTLKSTASDRKLYKSINKDLSSQHASLLKLGASLSPPEREQMMATSSSLQLFSKSAFGPLSELSSRRIYAYLIATLNASHPHYDFSNVLRPGDFTRERNLRHVMSDLDSILQNVNPRPMATSLGPSHVSSLNAAWGTRCWSLIHKEMRLNECTVFSWHPEPDPFEEDESAIWANHYFFFNPTLKRVAYLYVRVVRVVSSTSPSMRCTTLGSHKRHHHPDFDSLEGGGGGGGGGGHSKRARYSFPDHHDDEFAHSFEDDDGGGDLDDHMFWNRTQDGDLLPYSDDDYFVELVGEDDEPYDDEDEGEDEDDVGVESGKRGGRLMSEDVAGRMEI